MKSSMIEKSQTGNENNHHARFHLTIKKQIIYR